ncbi:MAG: WG repeat-containing protein [Bacteroides sp.]|nr:WG repeat-containing protein [Bacteroides sp.]
MPEYDAVSLRENGLVEVCQNGKHGLLDSEGVELLPIAYDSIGAFTDNQALLFNDSQFVGFVNPAGKMVKVSSDYVLVPEMEFFSEGFLTVKKGNHYYYLNTEGNSVAGPFAEVEPYFGGFAAVVCYEDIEKKPNDRYNAYINTNQTLVHIMEYGKKKDELKRDDISFLSSFRNGRAMYVYKRKAYFLTDSLISTPISSDSLASKKTVIQFDKDSELSPIEGGYLLKSKTGYFYFNQFHQLDKIENAGVNLYVYNAPVKEEIKHETDLTAFGEPGAMGVKYKGDVVLPEQFADVIPLGGQYAAVKTNDKWGIIRLDTLNQFILRLNNNEHIGFNHRYFIAKLAASMPSYLKCSNATIVSKSDDCEIQIESRHENDNIERNTLTYDCRLAIPQNLSDTLAMQEYTYAIKYNGFTSIDYKVQIPEWYVKYYEVELSNDRFTLTPNDTISVEFDLVKTDVARNDETNYFKNVELITNESDAIPLNKITENHYGFRIGGVDREKLSFIVRITEVGCPSIEYPFEMIFEKPETNSPKKAVDVIVNPVRKVPGVPAFILDKESPIENQPIVPVDSIATSPLPLPQPEAQPQPEVQP